MLIFVSSPYRGDIDHNAEMARQYCRFVISEGHTPFAPHLLYPSIITRDEKGIDMGVDVLIRCDEVWQFNGMTEGMEIEGEQAIIHDIPVHTMIADGNGGYVKQIED
ncbi:MAG: DUF4406 domain-containing protein [Dehalococcoidia bacterium]|jgi:hypothetical protein